MKMREHIEGSDLTLSLEGNFDETTSLEIEKKIESILSGETKKLLLDLRGVKYVSSAGIRVLIIAHKRAVKTGKKVVIGEMSGKVKEILDTVGIMPLFSDGAGE